MLNQFILYRIKLHYRWKLAIFVVNLKTKTFEKLRNRAKRHIENNGKQNQKDIGKSEKENCKTFFEPTDRELSEIR